MAFPAISKLVVIGVGLIGGSFALALRQAGLVGRIVGIASVNFVKRYRLLYGYSLLFLLRRKKLYLPAVSLISN